MTRISEAAIDRLRAAAALPEIGSGRYRAVRELGRGGMGVVYLARDEVLDRDVAIKVFSAAPDHQDVAARLRREAWILARLEHPGIVPVHDAGALSDGRLFYAMKWVQGSSLGEVRPPSSLAETLRLFLRICEPVGFGHSRGVIHRDLKPGNVMIGPFGEVLVMDWGIAKLLGEAQADRAGEHQADLPAEGDTGGGTVLGTAGFMAPEQRDGRMEELGARTDIWALGALLRFLVKDAGRNDAVGWKRAKNALEAISSRAMAHESGARYASVEELSSDVGNLLDGKPVSVYEPTLLERISSWSSRNQAAITVVMAYLVMRLILFLTLGR